MNEARHPLMETLQRGLNVTALKQRSTQLAAANAELKREITHRKKIEESLRFSEQTTSQLLDQSRHMQEELRHLSRSLLSVQEEERKSISRELHDVVGQTLACINLDLAALKVQTCSNTQDLQSNITCTQLLVKKSLEIVHRFARDLRPAVLDDLGIIPALESYLQAFTAQTGIRTAFTSFAAVEVLPGASLTALYRVAQEALTNIAKHSKAKQATITLRLRGGTVHMDIHDDGKGFAVNGAALCQRSKRLGLLGMRERVEMIGGTFCIASVPGASTTIRVEIPNGKAHLGKKPHSSHESPAPIMRKLSIVAIASSPIGKRVQVPVN